MRVTTVRKQGNRFDVSYPGTPTRTPAELCRTLGFPVLIAAHHHD